MRMPLAHEQTPIYLDCALGGFFQGNKMFKDGISAVPCVARPLPSAAGQ